MSFPVIPTIEQVRQLDAIIAARYPNDEETPTLLKLFKNNVNPDIASTAETFEAADFAGYSNVELTIAPPSQNDQGMIVTHSQLCAFSSNAGAAEQTVYGVFIVDDEGELVAAQRFDTPQVMGGALVKSVNGVWRFSQPQTNYGWVDTEG